MPSILDSINRSVLSETEYDLLEIINRNPDFMWSNQLPELAELAAWQLQPRRPAKDRPIAILPKGDVPGGEGIKEPLKDGNSKEPNGLSIHDRVQARVSSWSGKNPETKRTLSLRVISNCLYRLVDLGYIMGFLLSKKAHFASLKSHELIIKQLNESVPHTISDKDFIRYELTDPEKALSEITKGESPFRNWVSEKTKPDASRKKSRA